MIAGIVLAAGASRRLGVTKQLLPLGGRPLVAWALDAMHAVAPAHLVLVLGHDAERIEQEVAAPWLRIVRNPRYAEGQSTSLQVGLRALPPEAEAALIATADQPFVTAGHLLALVAAYRASGKPIVATRYDEHDGVPLLLAREAWPLAEAITGDQGARPLLRDRPALVARVAATDPAMALDVDTPEAYASVLARVEDPGA